MKLLMSGKRAEEITSDPRNFVSLTERYYQHPNGEITRDVWFETAAGARIYIERGAPCPGLNFDFFKTLAE